MATVAFPSPPAHLLKTRPISAEKNLTFRVRSSADAATAEEDTTVGSSRRSSSSLLSADNVQKALRGVAITSVDHYGRLGLARGCSYDQVTTAYEKKFKIS